ncbi:hypothetical protein ACFWBI_00590 [Streptomyces sp. NPDC059982]|uniref:hypothetical protein n=1 Tax=unclassified Streptomyces TaxID=2593676 RepID=UPI0036B5FCC4
MPQAHAGSGPRRRSVLAAALVPLAAAGCTAGQAPRSPAPGPQPSAKDALVMVIRHAEKPYAGDTAEDEDGVPHPGSLAGRGVRRAEELHRLFAPAEHARLPRPAVLFATGGPAGAPARCKQTLEPMATALRMPVRGEFALGGEAELARAILEGRMPVLVCWEHTGVPRLLHALGADRILGLPAAWPDRYDLVWTFTRTQGQWSFRELGQHLLPGDA